MIHRVITHRERHPEYVEGCFACKALSVNLAAAAIPNRRPVPTDIDRRDRALSADLPAYKRLRRDGLQPKAVDGSAELEKRVNSQWDINLGRYVPEKDMPRVREAVEVSKELGYITEGGR